MTKPPKRNSKFSSTPAAPAASVSASVPARTRSDNACRIAGTVAGSSAKSGAEPSACGAPLKRTRCGGGAAPLAMPSALVTVSSMDGTSSGRSSENTTTDGASPFAIPGAARAARHQLRQPRRRLDWRVARHRARRCARPARAVARRCERRHPCGRARRPAAAAAADAFLISSFVRDCDALASSLTAAQKDCDLPCRRPRNSRSRKGACAGISVWLRDVAAPGCVRAVAVKPRAGSVLVRARLVFLLFGHQIPFEAQIEALLPQSIPFRSRRARDSAPVALARTRCWLSLYVPPFGRAGWAQAKARQAAC